MVTFLWIAVCSWQTSVKQVPSHPFSRQSASFNAAAQPAFPSTAEQQQQPDRHFAAPVQEPLHCSPGVCLCHTFCIDDVSNLARLH